jgi:serine/threonine protein kinase
VTTTNPEKIGRYRIVERVGRGGMGVLYRGIDAVLDREVAIKVMLLDFSDDEEQLRARYPGVKFVSWREFGSTHAVNEKELLASLPQRFKELGVDAAISSMAC